MQILLKFITKGPNNIKQALIQLLVQNRQQENIWTLDSMCWKCTT